MKQGIGAIVGVFFFLPSFASALVCPSLSHDLIRGSRDSSASGEVTLLQRFLADMNLQGYENNVTGYFGALTQARVMDFQATHAITPVGKVDVLTRTLIAALCAPRASTSSNPNVRSAGISASSSTSRQSLIPFGQPPVTAVTPINKTVTNGAASSTTQAEVAVPALDWAQVPQFTSPPVCVLGICRQTAAPTCSVKVQASALSYPASTSISWTSQNAEYGIGPRGFVGPSGSESIFGAALPTQTYSFYGQAGTVFCSSGSLSGAQSCPLAVVPAASACAGTWTPVQNGSCTQWQCL